MVKNGPSFRDRIEIAPTSRSLPNSPTNAAYRPPLELLIAAMIATPVRPKIPSAPNRCSTPNPRAMATNSLVRVMVPPCNSACGAALKLMPAPMHSRKAPISGAAPFLNSAVVKPPISSACGAKVLIIAPSTSGTTIIPPGIFSIVALIFILPSSL
ncbi:hypothetical protein D3C77_602720 [compost metagenome]